MKKRNGFVSNSSSSSFILSLPKRPETKEELFNYMFFEGDVRYNDPYDDRSYPIEDAVSAVMDQLKDQNSMTIEQMAEEISCGHNEDAIMPLDCFKNGEGDYDWDSYTEYLKEEARRRANNFVRLHDNKKFFSVSFSDNEGDFQSAMEHGYAFDRIPHIRCNYH